MPFKPKLLTDYAPPVPTVVRQLNDAESMVVELEGRLAEAVAACRMVVDSSEGRLSPSVAEHAARAVVRKAEEG